MKLDEVSTNRLLYASTDTSIVMETVAAALVMIYTKQ